MQKHIICNLLLFLLLIANGKNTFPQSNIEERIDSIKELVLNSSGLKKIKYLNDLSFCIFSVSADSALKYAQQSYDLAVKYSADTLAAKALWRIGTPYLVLGKFDSSGLAYQKALTIFSKKNDYNGIAITYNYIGQLLFRKGDYIHAMKYFSRAFYVFRTKKPGGYLRNAMESLDGIGNISFARKDFTKALYFFQSELKIAEIYSMSEDVLPSIFIKIANVYSIQNKDDDALAYYFKALNIQKKFGSLYEIPYTLNSIGIIYLNRKLFKKALPYFENAVKLYKKTGNNFEIAAPYENIGQIKMHMGNFNEAIVYFNKALDLRIRNSEESMIAYLQSDIGELYFKMGQNVKALEFLEKSLELSKRLGLKDYIYLNCDLISSVYKSMGNFKKALDYHISYSEAKDSVLNADVHKQVTEILTKYETAKKEKEIVVLKKNGEIQTLEIGRRKLIIIFLFAGLIVVFAFIIILFKNFREIRNLLLNILPWQISRELKRYGKVKAKNYNSVTVLFTDFKGFTKITEELTPEQLVDQLSGCFGTFDDIITKYKIEKIKTIGDAYMCASGLPDPDDHNPEGIIQAAVEFLSYINKSNEERKIYNIPSFEIRIGIHTGPVIAGIVGTKKYSYDIWGDTVNIAARMESSGEPGKINVSEATYQLVKNKFNFIHRGKIMAKNKGHCDMYFFESFKEV